MDDSRKRILERRAQFVAAAIASVSIGACHEKPTVCLAPVANEQYDAKPAEAAASATATATNEPEDVGVAPMPCLAPPPATTAAPAVCLSPLPPPKGR